MRDDREHRLQTAGRLIVDMHVRLLDDDGDDITTPDTPGHPVCKGPATCLGYLDDPARRRRAVHRRRVDAHRRPLHHRRRRLPPRRRAHVRHHHPGRQEHQRPRGRGRGGRAPGGGRRRRGGHARRGVRRARVPVRRARAGRDARARRRWSTFLRDRRACHPSGSPSGWSCSTRCHARRAARWPRASCAPTSADDSTPVVEGLRRRPTSSPRPGLFGLNYGRETPARRDRRAPRVRDRARRAPAPELSHALDRRRLRGLSDRSPTMGSWATPGLPPSSPPTDRSTGCACLASTATRSSDVSSVVTRRAAFRIGPRDTGCAGRQPPLPAGNGDARDDLDDLVRTAHPDRRHDRRARAANSSLRRCWFDASPRRADRSRRPSLLRRPTSSPLASGALLITFRLHLADAVSSRRRTV